MHSIFTVEDEYFRASSSWLIYFLKSSIVQSFLLLSSSTRETQHWQPRIGVKLF